MRNALSALLIVLLIPTAVSAKSSLGPAQWKDPCKHLYKSAHCYFAAHQWKKALAAYKSRAYRAENVTEAEMATGFYEKAIAYRNLGDTENEADESYMAWEANHPSVIVPPRLWKLIQEEYHRTAGSSATSESAANAETKREAALSADEQEVERKEAGQPCHTEVYDHGANYHKVTWWYCNADGSYRLAYTFLNGRLQSTFKP